MVRYGFPALLSMNLTTLAMVYFTHQDGIDIVLKNPSPFVEALVTMVQSNHLQGIDLDYEPQNVYNTIVKNTNTLSDSNNVSSLSSSSVSSERNNNDPFFTFLNLLGTRMEQNNFSLTIDATGGCDSIDCTNYFRTIGLTQVNTMDTFNIQSLNDFKGMVQNDLPFLQNRWAPGFEPGNFNDNTGTLHKAILTYAIQSNVSSIATWAIHEYNVGNQPDYLFENVNMFLNSS